MSAQVVIHIVSGVLIIMFAGFLMICPRYKDGIVGRFGLAALIFSSFMVLIRWFEGYPFYPAASEISTNIGVVIFLGWHCFRFARRILHEGTQQRRASDKGLLEIER